MFDLISNILTQYTKILAIVTVCVLILEVCSGVFKAVKNKELNSTKFRIGLYGKIGYFIYIALAFLIAILLDLPLILQATLTFVIGSESVSILENLSLAGLKTPTFLKELLEKIKNDGDSGSNADLTKNNANNIEEVNNK